MSLPKVEPSKNQLYSGFYLGFFVWGGGGESILKKNFGAMQRREIQFLGLLGGSGRMLSRKLLKR